MACYNLGVPADPEQLILFVVIVVCSAVLAVARPRAASASPKSTRPDDTASMPEPENTKDPARPAARRAKFAFLAVWVAVAAFILGRGGDPIGVRPDSWSDANVVVAGRNYARSGLLANCAAAQHQVVTAKNPPDPFYLYVRYPILSSLINGAWQRVGVTSPRVHRLVPAVCSLVAVWLWFGVFRRFAGPVVAALAASVMVSCYVFLAYADNLFFHSYALLAAAGAGASGAFVRAMDPGEHRRWRWFLLTAVLLLLLALLTWEYHLFIVGFMALYALLFPSPVRRGYLGLLVLPLLAALTLQVAQRRIALGGVERSAAAEGRVRSTFLDDVYRRTIGFGSATDSPHDLTLIRYPLFVAAHFFNVYGLPLPAALAMFLALLMRDRQAPWRWREWPDDCKLVVILLAAGAGWWLIMLQHTAVHPHVMRHFLPAYALLMALVWARGWRVVSSPAFGLISRGAAAVLMLSLVHPQLEGLVCNLRMHLDNSYIDRRGRGDYGEHEGRQFSQLRETVPPGAVIVTNHNRLPLMRVWSERPVYWGFLLPMRNSHTNRVYLELTYNHLRELYAEKLPPFYYVYNIWETDIQREFEADPLFRLLLIGTIEPGEAGWRTAASILSDVRIQGRTTRSACPIVAQIGPMLCFQIDRLVPLLNRDYAPLGFPTQQEFGPAP